jgi:hypothetical protein
MKKRIDMDGRIKRYKQFYSDAKNGRLLMIANFPGKSTMKGIDLRDFDFSRESEHKRYWDILIEMQLEAIQNHEGVEDDWIPGITVHYGFGAFGTVFCDGELKFTDDTSFMKPVLDDWNRMDSIGYSKDRFWSQIFIEAERYLSEKGQGQFMVTSYPSPSPLDAANLVRGNEIFTDFFEYENELKELLKLTTKAVIENAKEIKKALHNPWGGTFAFNRWIPDGLLLLEDAADLCSPQLYAEFGMPCTQEVINRMGGAYIHHHSLGRQQFRNVSALTGLYVQQMSSDPNCIRPVTDLDYVQGEVGNTVIDLECTAEEVYRHMDHIRRGRTILLVNCKDRQEAIKLVDFVRESEERIGNENE